MPRPKLGDSTYFKHTKEQKQRWLLASKKDAAKDLSTWMRDTLDAEADLTLQE